MQNSECYKRGESTPELFFAVHLLCDGIPLLLQGNAGIVHGVQHLQELCVVRIPPGLALSFPAAKPEASLYCP